MTRVEVIREEIPPPVKEVVITLSAEGAEHLRAVLCSLLDNKPHELLLLQRKLKGAGFTKYYTNVPRIINMFDLKLSD